MSDVVIQVDSLYKKYRLGVLGTGTLRHDFNRWLHRVAGKPDPYAIVGEKQKVESRKQKSEVAGAKIEDTNQFQLSAFPISTFPKPTFPISAFAGVNDARTH